VVPSIYAIHQKFAMCTATRTSSYSPVGSSVFLYLAQVCILCVCIALICLCVPILLCFPGQLYCVEWDVKL